MTDDPPGEIFLLGCGRSVNDLTQAEKDHINRSGHVYALNKFMAFYRQAGIRPTHVWFIDDHGPSEKVLQHIFDVCRHDRLRGLTFILGLHARGRVYFSPAAWQFARFRRMLCWRLLRLDCHLYLAPRNCALEYVSPSKVFMETWADTLDEPLFSYRTSFTSALNYLAIRYPGSKVKLVGCDFDSPGYFFQAEMERMALQWDDWTTPLARQAGQHPAAQPWRGLPPVTSMFPFMTERLRERGVTLACVNPGGLLVREGLVPHEPVVSSR